MASEDKSMASFLISTKLQVSYWALPVCSRKVHVRDKVV